MLRYRGEAAGDVDDGWAVVEHGVEVCFGHDNSPFRFVGDWGWARPAKASRPARPRAKQRVPG